MIVDLLKFKEAKGNNVLERGTFYVAE